MTNWMSEN